MSTLITDDVYEAVLAERVCAERSKDSASTLMGVPKTESGHNASAEASYPRLLIIGLRCPNASAEALYPRLLLIIGILLAMSQCQRGGLVSATPAYYGHLACDVPMPARRLRIRDIIIEVLERAQAMKFPVPQYFLAEQADSTLNLGAFMVPV
jgi:hypothetical protein